jgi:hypothetical protein
MPCSIPESFRISSIPATSGSSALMQVSGREAASLTIRNGTVSSASGSSRHTCSLTGPSYCQAYHCPYPGQQWCDSKNSDNAVFSPWKAVNQNLLKVRQ